jgi:hypothetical protein
MIEIDSTSRRTFLRAAGISLALPALEAYADDKKPAGAKAQRLVCIGSNLGFYKPAFYPKETGYGYSPSTLLAHTHRHRRDYTVLSKFDHRAGNGHGNWDNFLCGKQKGTISLDQLAAEVIGEHTRIPSLQLCAGGLPSIQRLSYSRQGVPQPMINRPSVVYNKMFVSSANRARTDHLLRSGKSALDTVRKDAARLQQRVGTADREKLDEYFTSLREVERRMGRQLEHLKKGNAKTVDYQLPPYDPVAPTLMLEAEQIMFDLIAIALETDSTRVAAMFLAGLGQVFTLDGVTLQAGYHALSHHGGDQDLIRDLVRVEEEHMKCLDRFLTQLKQKKDVQGRPLLDSTIVLFGTGMGDASRHANNDLPTIVAGGGFKHGRHLQAGKDQLLGDVFLTILHQLGIEADRFSNATRGLSELV